MAITILPEQPPFDSTLTKVVGGDKNVATVDSIQNDVLSRVLVELRIHSAYFREFIDEQITEEDIEG